MAGRRQQRREHRLQHRHLDGTGPCPVRSRSNSAVTIAPYRCAPDMKSATGTPALSGRPPFSPVALISPLIAWIVRSSARLCAYGPVLPKPEADA